MADLKYRPVAHDHEAFLKNARKRKGFRRAYKELEEEYSLIREMLAARSMLGLTQEAVAALMGTTKSAVSRLETAGKHAPSLNTLKKYAKAVGCRLEIRLVAESYQVRKVAEGRGEKGTAG
jgi:DNA-binding XRE family transcriptional regulator